MNDLEARVNNYINNELLNFSNIETNELEGKDLKDSILNNYIYFFTYKFKPGI